MKVLGVSGSPIPESNTDRAVKAALAATGLGSEFVKLSEYTVAPCRACLGCLKTNRCVIEDDGILIADKAREADALIVGGFTPYSSLDSRTKAFLERLYPLRHVHGFMRGKPGGAIVTCAIPEGNAMLPPACDMGVNAIMFYMMEEGMNFMGSVKILGNVPCIRCGKGDECPMSGLKMIFGPDATVDTVAKNAFENQPAALDAAKELGRRIGEALRQKAQPS
ncbi:MAG: flavodoxin family protein [Chloroflexota bacterium]